MRAKRGNVGSTLKMNEISRVVVTCLFTDDIVLFAESEENFRVLDEFYIISRRKTLKMKAEKSRVMIFKKK